jgi:hypothetical protein
MTSPTSPDTHATEAAFFNALKGKTPAVILGTSSPDKRTDFSRLFNTLSDGSATGAHGVNLVYTHTGALGITPNNVPEKQGDYALHVTKKAEALAQQIAHHEASIRNRFKGSGIKDHATMPLVSMTEDSGWEIAFDNERQKRTFLNAVSALLADHFRPEDRKWLFNHITDAFPGPNLKPFQEHLRGGLNELMHVIYDAADASGIAQPLRYTNHVHVAFSVTEREKQHSLTKSFQSSGTLVERSQFEKIVQNIKVGEAINSDNIHIPDGQDIDVPCTFAEMGKARFSTHSSVLPCAFGRRQCVEWLQERLGTQPAHEHLPELHIAYVSPSLFEGTRTEISADTEDFLSAALPSREVQVVRVPTRSELRDYPTVRMLNGSDMIVLSPDTPEKHGGLTYDPNLMLANYIAVSTLTDPLSMGKPVLLDNRSGGFNHVLEIYRHGFATGRFAGEFPFLVADSDEELQTLIAQQAEILGQVKVKSWDRKHSANTPSKAITLVPEDGVLSVFVAGGHANNNKQDRNDAHALGHYLAEQGIRIVTGGGQIEGSMGGVHTGFIQYHLDRLKADVTKVNALDDETRQTLASCITRDARGREIYNAETLIEHHSDLLNQLAECGHIPRDMFYAYSTQPLIDMESPNHEVPCATFYQDTGNRVLRLDGLMATGTKIFMAGSSGTDEEIVHAFKQAVEARMSRQKAPNDNSPYTDGTPQEDGAILFHDPRGVFDAVLKEYGLMHADGRLTETCTRYGIDKTEKLTMAKEWVDTRIKSTQSWRDRLATTRTDEEQHTSVHRL